jgi:hypothetical protein
MTPTLAHLSHKIKDRKIKIDCLPQPYNFQSYFREKCNLKIFKMVLQTNEKIATFFHIYLKTYSTALGI